MKKIIATLVLGLLLSFGVIDLAAHTITQQTDKKEDKMEKDKKEDKMERKMKKHRRHHRHHHRRMMKK